MEAAAMDTGTIGKFALAEELGLCPLCGTVMNEVDQLTEGEFTYIWLECGADDCNGRWLQKREAQLART